MLVDPATEILGMSPICSMDSNNRVACTARPQSANGSEPRAGRQPGSCCVCWVGLLRRVPCGSGSGADRLMECPAQREARQGAGRRQDAPRWHAWQRADTAEKPCIWPSKDVISQLTIRLVVEGSERWPFLCLQTGLPTTNPMSPSVLLGCIANACIHVLPRMKDASEMNRQQGTPILTGRCWN
jgi:hypothetical protein